jgi:hypothetical protein
MTDCFSGCLCACRRGLASRAGGKCVRCKIADMEPGLAKSVTTALLPIFNSDLPEPGDGMVWAKNGSGQAGAILAIAQRVPETDIEAA